VARRGQQERRDSPDNVDRPVSEELLVLMDRMVPLVTLAVLDFPEMLGHLEQRDRMERLEHLEPLDSPETMGKQGTLGQLDNLVPLAVQDRTALGVQMES